MVAKPRDIRWDDLHLLRAVARAGSFLAAGRELGCATSTLSRRLTRLEAALGLPLVDRRSDGVALTEGGRRLNAVAEDVELRLRAGIRDLRAGGGELRGAVRVTTTDGFSDVLAGVMADFKERHPGVSFELAVDSRAYDLSRREADLALRFWRGGEKSLVYVPIARLPYGLFASRDYVRRRGPVRSARELKGQSFVGYAPPADRLPAMLWLRELGASDFALRTTNITTIVAGVRAGLGIAAMAEALAGGLERVLPSLHPEPSPLYLVTHQETRRLPHVRAFARALAERVRVLSAGVAPPTDARPAPL